MIDGQGGQQGAVELVYQPTRQDYASALRARTRVSKAGRRQRRAMVAVLVAGVLTVVLAIAGRGVNWQLTGSLVLCGVLLTVSPWLQGSQLYRFAARQGNWRATVADSGLVLTTDNSSLTVNWHMQSRFLETTDLFVLLSGDKNATGLTVLPKRGAQYPANVEQLRAILDRNLQRA